MIPSVQVWTWSCNRRRWRIEAIQYILLKMSKWKLLLRYNTDIMMHLLYIDLQQLLYWQQRFDESSLETINIWLITGLSGICMKPRCNSWCNIEYVEHLYTVFVRTDHLAVCKHRSYERKAADSLTDCLSSVWLLVSSHRPVKLLCSHLFVTQSFFAVWHQVAEQ